MEIYSGICVWTLHVSVRRSEQFFESVAWGKLWTNWGTDNVQGQISEHIFVPNGGYCINYSSNIFCNMLILKSGEYHMTCSDQSLASKRFDGL